MTDRIIMSVLVTYRANKCLRQRPSSPIVAGVGFLLMRIWKINVVIMKKPKKMICTNRPPRMMCSPDEGLEELETMIPAPIQGEYN